MKFLPQDLAPRLRLEVETTPASLPNLVKNPSGAQGAWGYVTSVISTVITSDGTALKFTTLAAQAAYFYTEMAPIVPGRYVAARFDAAGSTAGYQVRARFVFFDANKANILNGPQSGYLAGTPQTHYVASALAPAGAAYVVLRLDFYANTSGGNPAANTFYSINKVMVTHAASSGAIATSRTNRVTNPSFETNTTGWAAGPFAAIARVTTLAYLGTACLRATQTASPPQGAVGAESASFPIGGGGTFTATAYVRAATTPRPAYVQIYWKDAANQWVGAGTPRTYVTDSTSAWARVQTTGVAPSAATKAVVYVYFGAPGDHPATNEQHYIDAVMLEESITAGAYFDGATTGTATYAWTGTAHGSTSTETQAASYAFVDPITWRNILGPTSALEIDRAALDLGTLDATIFDALLDPAVTTDLSSGRAVRLLADVGGTWDSVAELAIEDAEASYVRDKKTGEIRTTITLTATDNLGKAANQLERRGVPYVSSLAYILEGKGIPWNVNGSGNQTSTSPIVSTNENASVVDQIAITCASSDATTGPGYAWVDRYNVMTAYDGIFMPDAGVPAVTFSDVPDADPDAQSWSSIQTSAGTKEVINEVMVMWLRSNPATGETQEIPYGPYRDATSAATYRPRRRTFTLHGMTESPSSIAAFAAAVLAANATPVKRVKSLVMPVTDDRSLRHAVTLDLYSLVEITYTGIVTAQYRITSIHHSISADGAWLVTYGFGLEGQAAPAAAAPSPLGKQATDGVWIAPTLAGAWANYGGTYAPAGYMREGGWVSLKGFVKSGTGLVFTLPPGYRPDDFEVFTTDGNGAYARVVVEDDGDVRLTVGSGTTDLSLSNIRFKAVQ